MVIAYIDTSAALTRVLPEASSRDLAAEFARSAELDRSVVTSSLTRIEVSRALRRRPRESVTSFDEAFREALQGIAQAPMTELIVEVSRTVGPPALRSRDAIHLATAVVLGAHEMWTYDDRLADAARDVGIAVQAPGRDPRDG